MPYDKSIWRKLRDPLWYLFTLLSICPFYGISVIFNIFCFFMVDKQDEFQLCEFILNFKGTQFISSGVVSAMIASVLYFICANQSPPTCDTIGPGADLWQVALFVLQMFFVWIAFFLLPFSQQKGGVFYQKARSEV